ncbi:hypothetical protein FACS189499_00420 [Clostridia bacterium]|nr:hypothetical protein FACS189499_00420 [Clostridia bacterium]
MSRYIICAIAMVAGFYVSCFTDDFLRRIRQSGLKNESKTLYNFWKFGAVLVVFAGIIGFMVRE